MMKMNSALSNTNSLSIAHYLYCFDVSVAMNVGLWIYKPKMPCFLAIPLTGSNLQVRMFDVVQYGPVWSDVVQCGN